eukprot:338034_1
MLMSDFCRLCVSIAIKNRGFVICCTVDIRTCTNKSIINHIFQHQYDRAHGSDKTTNQQNPPTLSRFELLQGLTSMPVLVFSIHLRNVEGNSRCVSSIFSNLTEIV